ncbi:hypothetical protein AHF37_00837 [Paragonimus kellicotti]|nr:hypothetical protein AHF37_00837 [Paragonimus kellicotti]
MLNTVSSPYLLCKVLQSLVSVTLDNIILPLRKELKCCKQCFDIITLEIQDAENKTYEYLARQIYAICSAEEDVANLILREFPKSESCFKCLGINEDTTQGLLRIRGIGFLQLLDMPDEEVRTILRNYGDCDAEIDHVLGGLSKIRSNIGLVESAIDFADDTRNLIKLVIRLTEGDEDDLPNSRSVPRADSHLENSTSVIESGHLEYPQATTHCCNGPASLEHYSHNGVSTSNSFAKMKDFEEYLHPCETPRSLHTSRGSLQRQPALNINQNIYSRAPSIRTDIFPNVVGSAPMTSQYLNHLTSANGFRTFGHTASPVISNFTWEGDVHLLNGGLSVPTTPVWSGKTTSNLTVSPPSLNKSDRIVLATEDRSPPSPRSKRFQPHTISYHTRDRGPHSRHPGTPPPKHRLKLIFPLHRSKSHESDLANRIIPPVMNSIPNAAYPFETSRTNLVSPDASSNTNGEAFQCDVNTYSPITTMFKSVNNSHLSPLSQTKGYAHGTYASSKTDVSLNPRLSVTINNSHSLDFIRRVSCDYRSPKTVWQPPTLMTTSVDGEGLVSILNLPGSANGSTLVVGSNGLMHKFEVESKFGDFVRGTPCAVCSNRMSFRLQHCLNCRIKVHSRCVPQSHRLRCLAPGQSSDASDSKGSPSASRKTHVNPHALSANTAGLRPAHSTPAFQGSESTSASSCTSSAPGSPFGVGVSVLSSQTNTDVSGQMPLTSPPHATIGHCTPGGLGSSRLSSPAGGHLFTTAVGQTHHSPHPGRCRNQFDFSVSNHVPADAHPVCVAPPTSTDSNPLVSTLSSVESERTVMDGVVRRLESMDSQDEPGNLARANSISVTLKEWGIPIESLVIGEVIGRGTFGTVYRAKWYGEVAVKRIDIDPDDVDGSARLEAFKREVALLHKTRHENLVLFMGACMKPPDLAIVTQLSQGETLYHQLHHRGTTIAINRTINIASQIAKGMGYLHAKGIVHRDLKTRNIFIEPNSRVVIGDFGVFNCMDLYKRAKWGNYLNVPPFWLSYTAPEIIQALNFNSVATVSELPFTPSSDVFAFGTVWYELLTNEFPFRGYPTETVIYLCGRGIRQNLRIPGPKDFKLSTFLHTLPYIDVVVSYAQYLPNYMRNTSMHITVTGSDTLWLTSMGNRYAAVIT